MQLPNGRKKLLENIRYATVYDDWNQRDNHLALLNNLINKHYPEYKLDRDQESVWFSRVMGGYQKWLLDLHMKAEISESFRKMDREGFFLTTLEHYLDEVRSVEDISILISMRDARYITDSIDLEIGKVIYKMKLAVAINRANNYQREDVDWFAKDIIKAIDNKLYR